MNAPPYLGLLLAGLFTTDGLLSHAEAGLYADGTTSQQTLAFGAPFSGRALAFRINVPGVGSGQRNTSACFLNSRHALTAAHNIDDLLAYNPTYEVADGTNFLTSRGNVIMVRSVLVHPTLDLAILEFAGPFRAATNQNIGSATVGDVTLSAGFGRWGTPETGLPPQDGGLRAWDARVANFVFSGSAPFYQSTWFGIDQDNLTLNGRAASGDSGGPVFNIRGELIGITAFGSTTLRSPGNTTYVYLGEPSVKAWLETNTPLPAPVLAMNPSAGGIAMRLTWDADAIGYRLQTSDALLRWTNLGNILSGPGSLEDPIAKRPGQFYRLFKP